MPPIVAHGIVLVMDATRSASQEQLAQAQALRHALERPQAVFGSYANGESPGYVLLPWNKIELPHALPAREMLSHPTVALLRQHGCRFEMARCSVMTGDGVHSAFRTLAKLDGEL